MEPNYIQENYQARVKVAIARLYRNAEDMMPEGGFVERNDMLMTDSAINLYDGSKRLRISTPDKYVGMWIDSSACDLIPIEVERPKLKPDDLIEIHVTADGPIIYKESNSNTPIISSLKTGDEVKCDRKELNVNNGKEEIRYHIVSCLDESLIGYWIVGSTKVKVPTSATIIELKPRVSVNSIDIDPTPPSKPKMARAARSRINTKGKGIIVDANAKDVLGNPIWTKLPNVGQYTGIPLLGAVIDMASEIIPETAEEVAKKTTSKNVTTSKGAYEVPEENITRIDHSDPTRTDRSSSYESIDEHINTSKTLGLVSDGLETANNVGRQNANSEGWIKFSSDDDEEATYNYYSYNVTYSGSSLGGVKITRMNYVHGLPFQYTALTDRRIGADTPDNENDSEADQYGRTFAQDILSNMPIAVFVPGEPTFLSAVSEGLLQKFNFLNKGRNEAMKDLRALMGAKELGSDAETDAIYRLLTGGDEEYDYFTMEVKLGEYYEYVNSMTRICARNMGLQDRKLSSGQRCDKVDWGNYNADVDNDSNLYEVLGLDGGVSFAYDAGSSVSDSISTSTGDSQLADLLNQSSSAVREINFVMGTATGKTFINSSAEEFVEDDGSGFFSRFKSFFNNTISGLNVRFPEVWQDSSSSKDYSLEMRFVAPYATSFCVWRYVLVPFCHVLALAAPRSTQRVNSYTGPFIIRAFSKGYFNVEMGIITGMTWKRFGDGDMISADGIPTQIDVTLDFKDLYRTFSISKWKTTNLGLFFNNTGLIDLLGTLSGVNMNRISIADRFSLYGFSFATSVSDIGTNFMRHVSDKVRNTVDKFLMRM